MGSMIDVKGLSKAYGNNLILDNMNITIGKHETVAFLGPSGCGKTTFLRCLSDIDRDYRGVINRKYKKAGFVFQEDRLIPWNTLERNLDFVSEDQDKIREALDTVGLLKHRHLHPTQLSGGMRQRANLARALLVEPEVIYFDEPFQSLDLKSKISLMDEIKDIYSKKQFTAVLVTHGIREALVFADRIVIMSREPARLIKEIDITKMRSQLQFFSPETARYEKKILSFYE